MHSFIKSAIIPLAALAIHGTLLAQGPGGRRVHTATEAQPLKLVPAKESAPDENKVEIKIEDGFRVIRSNSIPTHKVGKFPNPGNPNTISPQTLDLKLPLKPKASETATPTQGIVGVFLNGVCIEAKTAEFWNSGAGGWNYEALGGALNLGLDTNHAHVQPTGKYHYHGKPTGYLEDVKLSPGKHSPIVGWAFDGFPIYALYGYSDPNDPSSKVIEMTSSYRLKSGTRPSPPEGPGGKYDGAFTADYEYIKGAGTLDECNGCFTKTPDFPNGTYAYFLTNKWPVIFRDYRGTPAIRQPGGPGGPGGQRRPGPPGGRPQEGPRRNR